MESATQTSTNTGNQNEISPREYISEPCNGSVRENVGIQGRCVQDDFLGEDRQSKEGWRGKFFCFEFVLRPFGLMVGF